MNGPPTLARFVMRLVRYWLFLPGVALLVGGSAYLFVFEAAQFRQYGAGLSENMARSLDKYVADAFAALAASAGELPLDDEAKVDERLTTLRRVYPRFERVLLVSPQLAIAAASPQDVARLNFPLRLERLADEYVFLSRPAPSLVSRRLTIHLGARRPDGFILAGELNLQSLTELLRIHFPELRTEAIIVDGHGNVISHPDADLVETQANIGHLDILRRSKAGGSSAVYRDDDGRWLFGFVTDLPFTGWRIIIQKPLAGALGTILRPLLTSLGVALSLYVALLVALRRALRQRLVLPIQAFAASIQAMADGVGAGPAPSSEGFAELTLVETEFAAMAVAVRERERQLQEKEERFRQLVENVREVFWVQDVETGRLLYVSPNFEAVFGRSSNILYAAAESFLEAVHPEDVARVRLVSRALVEAGESSNVEYRVILPSGEERWIRSSAFLVGDRADGAGRVVGVAEDVTDRKREEEALRVVVREKETMLKEIHHRVKNNLQVISSLLNLQAHRIEDGPTRALFEESRLRVASMALVHEELYRSKNLADIDFDWYVRRLLEKLFRAMAGERRIEAVVDAADVRLPINMAVPCGLLLNELVTNALKHAFPDRDEGRVNVSIARADGRIELEVSDDGQGLPPDFSVDAAGSLGMQLVRSLAQQLHGELRVDAPGGARFRLSFPE